MHIENLQELSVGRKQITQNCFIYSVSTFKLIQRTPTLAGKDLLQIYKLLNF